MTWSRLTDKGKFNLILWFAGLLCVMCIAYNSVGTQFASDITGYIKRRYYYETVISRKGLSLEKARFWSKEK